MAERLCTGLTRSHESKMPHAKSRRSETRVSSTSKLLPLIGSGMFVTPSVRTKSAWCGEHVYSHQKARRLRKQAGQPPFDVKPNWPWIWRRFA